MTNISTCWGKCYYFLFIYMICIHAKCLLMIIFTYFCRRNLYQDDYTTRSHTIDPHHRQYYWECRVTYSQYHNLLPHAQYAACLREIGNLFIQFVYLVEPSIYDCDKIFWSKQSSIVRDLRWFLAWWEMSLSVYRGPRNIFAFFDCLHYYQRW